MLAVLGVAFSTFVQLPGEVHQVGVVAAHDAAVKSGAMSQILLFTSLFEIISSKAVNEMIEGSGNYINYLLEYFIICNKPLIIFYYL